MGARPHLPRHCRVDPVSLRSASSPKFGAGIIRWFADSVKSVVGAVPQFGHLANGGTKRSAYALRARLMNNEFDMESEWITELGKARSDEYTEKILAFVQELEKSAPEPFLPLLTDLALARALIVHLVIRYGPERGMAEARDAFESTLEQMKPLLERMKSRKGPPTQ